jgi:hypothetical protein
MNSGNLVGKEAPLAVGVPISTFPACLLLLLVL